MTMMFKCKNCGAENRAFVQYEGGPESQSFKTATMVNNSEQCRSCGQMSVNNKEDYFFK